MTKFSFGLIAEYVAIAWYFLRFYKIIRHRMRNYMGEIDFIATRGKNIVFVEVKARKRITFDPLVKQTQKSRIMNAAIVFMQSKPKYQNFQPRLDLVIITPYRLPVVIENIT